MDKLPLSDAVDRRVSAWERGAATLSPGEINRLLFEAKSQIRVCLPNDVGYWRNRRDVLMQELARRELLDRERKKQDRLAYFD